METPDPTSVRSAGLDQGGFRRAWAPDWLPYVRSLPLGVSVANGTIAAQSRELGGVV